MTIEEICNTVIRKEKALVFPLTVHLGWIADAEQHHIMDMRGWGYIQYHPAGPDAAAELQDAIGLWVVETLNKEAKAKGLY